MGADKSWKIFFVDSQKKTDDWEKVKTIKERRINEAVLFVSADQCTKHEGGPFGIECFGYGEFEEARVFLVVLGYFFVEFFKGDFAFEGFATEVENKECVGDKGVSWYVTGLSKKVEFTDILFA